MAPESEGAIRLPPQNLDAERSVLGSILRDNAVLDDVVQIVRTPNFYTDAHQKIFDASVKMRDRGDAVDLVTLAEYLKELKQIEDVGGAAYLAALWDAAPTAANAVYYARIVRDKALVRNLIHASTEILRDAYDQSAPATELLEGAERKIFDIAQMGVTGQYITLQAALDEAYRRIDVRVGRGPMAVSGLATGFVDLDEKTAGLQSSELIIIAARPSVGKCLSHDSEIVCADGSVTTIEEIYRRRQARLLTLRDDLRLGLTEPSAYVDDGIKPTYRVTTGLGRSIETTLSHPFLTLEGWRRLEELRPGDCVAVPRSVPVFGTETIRECEVKLLGYLLGDGGLTDCVPEFTNTSAQLRDDFTEAVSAFGAVKTRTHNLEGPRATGLSVAGDPAFIAEHRADFARRLKAAIRARFRTAREFAQQLGVTPSLVCLWQKAACVPQAEMFAAVCRLLGMEAGELAPHGHAAISRSSKNPLTLWLDGLGLWGKDAHQKFVPAVVFRLVKPQLALFLNRLFATDGWATVLSGGAGQLGYGTVSERLARQIQHLLLRFGIIAGLRRRTALYKGQRRRTWQLDITDQRAIRAFIAEIGIFGKEEALARVEWSLEGKKHKPNRDVIPVGVWERLAAAKGRESWGALARRAGLGGGHTNIHVGRRGLSRHRLARLAEALGDARLQDLASSDVYWDRIRSIEPTGMKQVYDLTIPGTHNFVANDVCVHNTAFSLNLVRNMIVQEQKSVFFVSLEQSRIELAERLLCSQGKVDSHRLRKGHLNADDMQKLMEASDQLSGAKLYIDDSPAQGMLRIAANARRLKMRHGLDVVFIDYLQLIEPDNKRDSRQEQVGAISRRLKFLAKELELPVVALAQVNRSSEDRQDHKPRLSDLRESGCLAGETLIPLADTGARVPLRELVGRSGFRVWALDEQTMKVRPAEVSRVFATGRKPVFRLETRLGRVLRATGNHQFRTLSGWQRLDTLTKGDRIALPRRLPTGVSNALSPAQASLLGRMLGDGCSLPRHSLQYTTRELDLAEGITDLARQVFGDRIKPRIVRDHNWYQVLLASADRLTHGRRNPLAAWLDSLGAFGFRALEKRAPGLLFEQDELTVALFLKHLWATDGCIRPPQGSTRYPAIYYASSSERLARDVQSLLLRLGINGVLRLRDQGDKGRPQFHVMVMGRDEVLTFAAKIGAEGAYKSEGLRASLAWLGGRQANTNRDVIPNTVWRSVVVPLMLARKITMRQLQRGLGMSFMGTGLYKQNVSRERLLRVSQAVGGDEGLSALAASDVYWDQIRTLEPDGVADVYDMTVPGPANFVANDIIAHNSIEQDADTVMMLHRPDAEPGQQGETIDVIIAKQRNGPTDTVTLTFMKQFMRFENFAVEPPFSYGS